MLVHAIIYEQRTTYNVQTMQQYIPNNTGMEFIKNVLMKPNHMLGCDKNRRYDFLENHEIEC